MHRVKEEILLIEWNRGYNFVSNAETGFFYFIDSYEIKSPPGGMRTAAYKADAAGRPPQARVSQVKLFFDSLETQEWRNRIWELYLI